MDKIDKCEKCGNLDVSYYCQYCDEPLVKSLQQELADLRAKLSNSTSLKNTYHDNWQDAKGTIDSQAEVINNLTVRWGKVCRELADLKAEFHEERVHAKKNIDKLISLEQLVGELLDECSMGKREGWVQPPSLFILDKLKQAIGEE